MLGWVKTIHLAGDSRPTYCTDDTLLDQFRYLATPPLAINFSWTDGGDITRYDCISMLFGAWCSKVEDLSDCKEIMTTYRRLATVRE